MPAQGRFSAENGRRLDEAARMRVKIAHVAWNSLVAAGEASRKGRKDRKGTSGE
jgi:hypothetical protein